MTNERLVEAMSDLARAENETLKSDLIREMGELEERVNRRLTVLEGKMELPRRVTAIGLTVAGFIGGTAGTALIDRLLGGGG